MPTQLIRLILLDGDPEGLRLASIAGRTTVLLACPWTQLKALLQRDEAKRPAAYFLVGAPSDGTGEHGYDQAIYIGECDSLAERFASQHHKADAAEWNQIFLVTTSEGTFNKAHARLAEYRLRERALEAKRAQVLTKTAGLGKTDEGDTAFAEEFVSNVVLLAQTLGLTLFRPPVSISKNLSNATTKTPHVKLSIDKSEELKHIFRFSYTNTEIPAELVLDGSESVIRAGSLARTKEGTGLPIGIAQRRQAARQAGILVATDNPDFERFTADYPTTSTSAAGAMIYGSACAGPIAWRHVETGQTYKDWLAGQTGASNA